MAWFSSKVSLGNFPDLAGAVNKLQESVKNIEKNFDTALGLEEKSDADTSSSEASGLWPPVMSFIGQKGERNAESVSRGGSPQKSSEVEDKEQPSSTSSEVEDKEQPSSTPKKTREEEEEENREEAKKGDLDEQSEVSEKKDEPRELAKVEAESEQQQPVPLEDPVSDIRNGIASDSVDLPPEKEMPDVAPVDNVESVEAVIANPEGNEEHQSAGVFISCTEAGNLADMSECVSDERMTMEETAGKNTHVQYEVSRDDRAEGSADIQAEEDTSSLKLENAEEVCNEARESSSPGAVPSHEASEEVPESVSLENDASHMFVEEDKSANVDTIGTTVQQPRSGPNISDSVDNMLEIAKLKTELKTMEAALQGAARQSQSKADEIAKLMNENEHLKAVNDDLKRKSNHDAEMESLREEYHQRVATLERKVYTLTKERDALRREQSRKSDAAALLKEKDEIINQVMAEGEELSKKQAAQESTIRKLRAQIRELEEEKKGLATKLKVEENKVECIRKDKTATEKLLQEEIEKHQTELTTQKEYYTNALTEAKEAEALAEQRANNEARSELESRLREAEERESMLVQTLEELRQTLSRKEQQAVFREDMLRRDVEDFQKRYQASERRCEELVTQVPESTRPLLRQIEAMQETSARRAEAWAAVERSLNSRLQEAEAKAASYEERERSVNERVSQTLSRVNVLEAQISCLRAEQTQLTRSLEKERQRASEMRQEYLAAKEEAETQAGRATQLEEELKDLRLKNKQDLQDAQVRWELLQQEFEKEKAARLDLERTSRAHSVVTDHTPIARSNSAFDGHLTRKVSSVSSLGSMEESYFLQASLDTSDSYSERRNAGEATMSPYYIKSMTHRTFESALRQKEGELASYMSRLASLESIRDSLADELVKMTEQCEKLRAESALFPGIRAELEALRRRHSAALELMGERDEELEELRADIVDLKEMYREQVNLLVNKIQIMSSSRDNA